MAAALKRYSWPALAALALLYLIALAVTGERPGPGLAPFEPQGLMRHIALDAVDAVEVAAAGQQWRFERTAEGTWWASRGHTVAGFDANLLVALKLLRNSAPERMLTQDEVAQSGVAQFDLATPRLQIAVHSKAATPFEISFGAANALGSARYAQVKGSAEIALLPAFAAEAWERLADIK